MEPAAREVLDAALTHGWADPLRHHYEGRQARLLVDNAREVAATLVGARPDEVSFVSSGTMACQLGVLGLRIGRRRVGTTVAHSAVEHSAVIAAARWAWEDEEASALSVPVDTVGRIDLAAWDAAVSTPGVAVSCLQAANHEVGTRQPVAAAYDVCRAHGVPLVVDASAALGWVDPPEGWDVLAASAHKWGGPAGVGLLAIRKGARWRSPWPEDEREPTQAGYLNIPGVLAAVAALQSVEAGRRVAADRMHALTSSLRTRLATGVPDVDLAGDPDDRLPHIVNASFLYVDGEALVTELDRAGFAVSSGSACTASTLEPSHVLAAMGVLTHGNVRISVSPDTRADELYRFATTLAAIVTRLRESAGVTQRSTDG